MPSLLLEIFSEEIPARMQADAAQNLKRLFEEAMGEAKLPCTAKSYVTPRRLALIVDEIPARQADATIEKKGPRVGAPQGAIDGFLKSTGLTLDTLEKRMVGKDETYFAVIHQKGQPTAIVLKAIIESIFVSFPWPKSMRWGAGETRWVRPLHSILCLFDGKVVPVEFAGIKAGNTTHGHRFLAPEAITIHKPEDYVEALRKARVLADAEERKAAILKEAEELAAKHHLKLKADAGLLAEVTGLVEWPTLLMGSIDKSFMDLPPEVLVSEMRAHQKYFALLDNSGALAPHFLIVSNMVTSDGGKAVIAGNERVLRARLSDGRFFFDQDRRKTLDDWGTGLAGVTFHAKIGALSRKVRHIKNLGVLLSSYVKGADKKKVERAAMLCKADLMTGMVGEFPELQGVMGRYYALHEKEDAEVADAIRDHYLPLGPDSSVPTKPVSVCIALADKIDTLIMLFGVGEKPTGSKDPFALRRSALGIIRIILENHLRLPLKEFLNAELLTFFADRLKVMLRDQGISHDVVAAVMAGGDDDLVRVVARAKALQAFLATEDGNNLLAAYRRAGNILAIESKKDGKDGAHYREAPDAKRLSQPEEKALSEKLAAVTPSLEKALKGEDYTSAMHTLASIRPPVDAFFEHVLVNAEDAQMRLNRLRLLSGISSVFNRIADFSVIEGK